MQNTAANHCAYAVLISDLNFLFYFAILADLLPLELCTAPDVPADPEAQVYFILLAALKVKNVKILLLLLVKSENHIVIVSMFWLLHEIALEIFSRAFIFN